MDGLNFSQFSRQFADNDACLEEFALIKYPKGIYCITCKKETNHYRITNRMAFSCSYCRHQVYPLKGTIFEKSSTPLQVWFLALFLMTQTKGTISVKQLQREMNVTYKTAWRIHSRIKKLMQQNHADLLLGAIEPIERQKTEKIRKWVFFNAIEFKVVQKRGNGE